MGNFLLNKTTSERFGYNVKRERARSFEEVQEKLDQRHVSGPLLSISQLPTKESAETTAPSLVSTTRGLLGKKKKSRGLQRYFTNCLDMCYRNERKALLEA